MRSVLICGRCGHRARVPNKVPGTRVKCPRCGAGAALLSEREAAASHAPGPGGEAAESPRTWRWLALAVLAGLLLLVLLDRLWLRLLL